MIALNFKMYVGIEFYNYVYYITHTHMYICVYKVNETQIYRTVF